MKTVFQLPGFSLDLTPLWNQKDGPRAADLHNTLEQADRAMRERFRSGAVGFYDLPETLMQAEPECLVAAVKKIRSEYEGALILGIGGSYLGAASAVQAVGSEGFPLTWISNIDPPAIRAASQAVKRGKQATIVISKSGNTTETLAAFYHFSSHLNHKGILVITDPQSGELRRLANENGWAAMEVPPNIGGRFSVLTPVGLLPAALGGVDTREMVSGAKQMRDALEASAPTENPAYLFARSLQLWDEECEHSLHYLMPYWSTLSKFAEWYVQLWGESLGKINANGRHAGPTAVAALGTTDQHSLLQLFKDGPRNKVVGFMDILGEGTSTPVGQAGFAPGASGYLCKHTFEEISHQALAATQKSLNNSGVPTFKFTLPRLTPAALGALYFFFETATAFAGELYGVNPFDQPGVEESKKLLHAALR